MMTAKPQERLLNDYCRIALNQRKLHRHWSVWKVVKASDIIEKNLRKIQAMKARQVMMLKDSREK